jgi:hypothetical protein
VIMGPDPRDVMGNMGEESGARGSLRLRSILPMGGFEERFT